MQLTFVVYTIFLLDVVGDGVGKEAIPQVMDIKFLGLHL